MNFKPYLFIIIATACFTFAALISSFIFISNYYFLTAFSVGILLLQAEILIAFCAREYYCKKQRKLSGSFSKLLECSEKFWDGYTLRDKRFVRRASLKSPEFLTVSFNSVFTFKNRFVTITFDLDKETIEIIKKSIKDFQFLYDVLPVSYLKNIILSFCTTFNKNTTYEDACIVLHDKREKLTKIFFASKKEK